MASNQRVKDWETRHPERAKAMRKQINKRSYAANREKLIPVMREWRSNNRERHRGMVRAWQERNPDKVEAYKARRRALEGAAVEFFSPRDIFERDNWTCHLCGKPTLRDLRARRLTHPRRATLDHLVPLSKGGAHTPTNVRCAHRECNQRRGTAALNEEMQ